MRGLGPSLGLDEVFDRHIAKMERREVDSSLERRYEERFQIPLAGALALLLVESLVRRRRVERTSRRPLRWLRGSSSSAVLWLIFSASPVLRGFVSRTQEPAVEGVELYEQGRFEESVARFGDLHDALGQMVAAVEEQLGAPLSELSREQKQAAVRLLDQRGAFLLRKAVESVGEMMGVSRITIYNYLNAIQADDD